MTGARLAPALGRPSGSPGWLVSDPIRDRHGDRALPGNGIDPPVLPVTGNYITAENVYTPANEIAYLL